MNAELKAESLAWSWDVPGDWDWTTMGQIAEVVGGGTPRTADSSNFEGGDISWITPADLSGYTEKHIQRGARNITRKGLDGSGARIVPAGTVLFTSRAPIGYVAIAAREVSTNQGFKSFILQDGIIPDYVFYYLQSVVDRIRGLASGTTFLELSGKKAATIPIPVAPVLQQRGIVEAIEEQLPRLEVAVASLRRARANLKRYRAAVLNSSFGTLNDPDLCRTAELGKVVEFVTSGSRGWAKYHSDHGALFLGVGNLRRLSIDLSMEETRHVKPPKSAEGRRTAVKDGDVLVSITADIGRVGVILEPIGEAYVNQHVALCRPSSAIDPRFLGWFLAAPEGGQVQLRARNRGFTKMGLGLDDIRNTRVPLPPISRQKGIVSSIRQHLSTVEMFDEDLQRFHQRSRALRQSVLASAFRGTLVPPSPQLSGE